MPNPNDFTPPTRRFSRGLMRFLFRRSVLAIAAVAAIASFTACQNDLTLPNYNSPTVEGLAGDPAGLQLGATGILLSERNNYFGYIRDVSLFGREGYYYFQTDARYVTDYLVGAGTGASRGLSPTGFAAGNWLGYFRNMRNEVNLATAVDASTVSDAQKAAGRGFANTMRALDLYYVVSLRDSLGAPVEIPDNPNDQAPFVSRDSVYGAISGLLESAKADLATAGSADFPFTLHEGFDGFDTPATFLKFNRALAARIFAIRGSLGCTACYTQALTAVSESFATAPGAAASLADLDVGVYNIYSTAPGDALNNLNYTQDANELAHASIVTDEQMQPDGTTPDARVTRKIATLDAPVGSPGGASKGINALYRFQMYPSNTSPTPIIRNEELLLIRAEANMVTNPGAALIDVNNVRAVSGGLGPIGVLNVDALIYERRASLLLEGFRWTDARRFGKLATLPLDLPIHFVARVMPIPKAECDARLTKPNGC